MKREQIQSIYWESIYFVKLPALFFFFYLFESLFYVCLQEQMCMALKTQVGPKQWHVILIMTLLTTTQPSTAPPPVQEKQWNHWVC